VNPEDPHKIERFTQRARRVLSISHDEAKDLLHDKVYPEHVLIGLMREENGVASRVLRELGLETSRVSDMVKRLHPPGDQSTEIPSKIELDNSTLEVLDYASTEAMGMGHHYIGTEHLLLGLVRLDEGVAVDVLRRLGISAPQIRRQLRRVLQEKAVLRPTNYVFYPSKFEAGQSMQEQIAALRNQVSSLKDELSDEELGKTDKLSEIVDDIDESRKELTAPVLLPSMESMSIRLVPSHSLERLEEYQSDEGHANLLAGIFGGGALGLVITLATGEATSLSPSSIALLVLLILLTFASVFWIYRIRSRISKIRDRILLVEDDSGHSLSDN